MFVNHEAHNTGAVSAEFLMDALSNLRGIKSSKMTQEAFKTLIEQGILPKIANHEWARLCIAYCFVKPNKNNAIAAAPDSLGMEIPNLSVCFQEDWRFWLALIAEQMVSDSNASNNKNIEIADIAKRINAYWHMGADMLMKRYEQLKFSYPNRYVLRQQWLSELAQCIRKEPIVSTVESSSSGVQTSTQTVGLTAVDLQESFQKISVPIKHMHEPKKGVRYDQFLIEFNSASDANNFDKKLDDLRSELAAHENKLVFEPCTDGIHRNSIILKVLRDESQWHPLDENKFKADLEYIPKNMALPVCVGADEMGEVVFEDLAVAPHVFVGGTSGSGKSVCIHGMLRSLLFRADSSQRQIALFDPKRVEFTMYKGNPNLWQNRIFIDDISDGVSLLVQEMERRYQLLEQLGHTNIKEIAQSERPPYIVVVVDELADLIMSDKDVEANIIRLAQKARACGIHLLLATQRPDSETFSGLLRGNVPARIALKVQKSTESKIILDETGAERLVGKGDRFVKWNGAKALRHGYNL